MCGKRAGIRRDVHRMCSIARVAAERTVPVARRGAAGAGVGGGRKPLLENHKMAMFDYEQESAGFKNIYRRPLQ